ncbi:MAG TPA: hydrolase, partial [Gammaproteobacteria bacterium]|nr:hydrolase [Gammaproteobacteria bacterium]
AQTIWPFIFPRGNKPALQRERLELPDTDFIDLAWTPETGGPIVVLLHGLEGSVQSHYASGMMSTLSQRGWRAVMMHFRGCSGEHNRLARGYHSGDTGDFRFLLEQIRNRYPARRLAAVGYSLGGNVLLKYLGEEKKQTPLCSAVAVSVPFDLSSAADRLQQGFSRFYQRYLINKIRQRIKNKFRHRKDAPFNIAELQKWRNFHLFDNFVTAPLHGFASSQEYYRLCSSRQFLKSITIPTLLLQAIDDPFLATDAIPAGKELAEPVTLELSNKGGHVGFIGGRVPWRPERWLEQRVPDYLADYLEL